MNLRAYLYDNDEKNPEEEDGVPVLFLDDPEIQSSLNTTFPVYIGTRGIYHSHISKLLKEIGFSDIRPVTVELDMKLRNAYVRERFHRTKKTFRKVDDGCLFVVKTFNDKSIHDAEILSDWEDFLQAGTALVPERISSARYYDNEGDNISCMNRQFCELTGLYWIWKNTDQPVVGLEHYRRRFILPQDWMERFLVSDADVILPVPLCVVPSLAENFCSRHDSEIWNCAMNTLKEQHPEDFDAATAFFNDSLYSPCNMFIMKRSVLEQYCSWLFPMLFKIADSEGIKEDAYLNRYPGFIAERFLSFWCSKYINEKRILFADKNFLG